MKNDEKNSQEKNLTTKRDRKDYEESLLRAILAEDDLGPEPEDELEDDWTLAPDWEPDPAWEPDLDLLREDEDPDYWLHKADELSKNPNRDPTPEQREAFQKRLYAEVERIQEQKRRDARAELCHLPDIRRTGAGRRMSHKIAMAFVFLLIVSGTTLYCSVESFAAGVERFIACVVPGGEEIRISDKQDGGVELDMEEFEGMYVPGWVPKRYCISGVETNSKMKKIIYSDEEGKIIYYEISADINSLAVDDEDIAEKKYFCMIPGGK